jgi:hypothetical protein
MIEATPSASFVVTQAEFLLQLLIVALDDPAMFGQVQQFEQSGIGRHGGQPVIGSDSSAGHSMAIILPHVVQPANSRGAQGAPAKRQSANWSLCFTPWRKVSFFQASAAKDSASSLAYTG